MISGMRTLGKLTILETTIANLYLPITAALSNNTFDFGAILQNTSFVS